MDADLRSRVWTVTSADPSLSKILTKGDRLIFHGEGETCGCICMDTAMQRRVIWENAYICEASAREPVTNDLPVTILRITGAMLSREHRPFLLDAALIDVAGDLQLFGAIHEAHEVHDEPLATRLAQAVRRHKDLKSIAEGLKRPGAGLPFGHASGQWHAEN